MATDCCDSKSTELEVMSRKTDQRRVLIAVLVVNAVMFVGELAVGLFAGSAALVADSADVRQAQGRPSSPCWPPASIASRSHRAPPQSAADV